MFCTNCETEVPDGAKYCPGCASPITTVESQAEAEAVVEETTEAIEELVEDVVDEPSPVEVELEIVQTHETGETERAQIAADAAVDIAAVEASVAVPVAEAEADAEAAVAEAVIASEVVSEPEVPIDSAPLDMVETSDIGSETGEVAGDSAESEEAELDDSPTVLHPWFKHRFGK